MAEKKNKFWLAWVIFALFPYKMFEIEAFNKV